MSIPNSLEKPNFGLNEGVWEYKTFDGDILCYVVRYQIHGKKSFKPYTLQEGKWLAKWFVNKDGDTLKDRPLYGLDKLKNYPDRKILLVEGEKTADAGQELFPEFNVLSWMGGAGMAKNVDLRHLKGKAVYLLPDNDKAGYKAMECLKERLGGLASDVFIVDIGSLSIIPEKWDLADFNDGIIDLEDIKILFEKNTKKVVEFELMDNKSFPYLSDTDRIINTYENIEHLLKFYNINVRFNEIRKEIEANIPYKQFTKANHSKLLLAEVVSLCNKNGVPRIDVPSWLMMIADKNAYNPVVEYLNIKPWDGICRKQEFFNTIKSENVAHRDFILERWMRGAVASGISKCGLAHTGVLTLLGETGNGKSAWIKKLVPEELNLLLADYTFNPNNKDDVISATKFWITELAEVASTVRRSDDDSLKAFLTRKIDVYRSPYDRADTEAPRKTSFVASVNDHQFLRDDTGNRRWWIIEAQDVDYEHNLDMQQIWAQFKHEYDQGQLYYLTREEIKELNKINEMYRPATSIHESISDRFCWDEPDRNLKASATQVLYECGFIDVRGNSTLTKEANKTLQKLTGGKPIKNGGVFKYSLPRLNPHYQKTMGQ